MQKVWAGFVTLILGGSRSVDNAIGAFTKAITQLDLAIAKLDAESQASYTREAKAQNRFHNKQQKEWARQDKVDAAAHRAKRIRAKVADLLGEDSSTSQESAA